MNRNPIFNCRSCSRTVTYRGKEITVCKSCGALHRLLPSELTTDQALATIAEAPYQEARIETLEARVQHLSEKMFNFFSRTEIIQDGQGALDRKIPCQPTARHPFIDQTWHELKLAMIELKNLKQEN